MTSDQRKMIERVQQVWDDLPESDKIFIRRENYEMFEALTNLSNEHIR